MAEIRSDLHGFGNIQIADEVIAIIAGTAAREVEGISLDAADSRDKAGRRDLPRNFARGVKVSVEDGEVSVHLNVGVKYGYKVTETALETQKRVKTAVETMTGLNVRAVDVSVESLNVPKPQKEA